VERKKFRKILRRAVWIPFGTALLLAAVLILELQAVTSREKWVEHTDQVIAVAQHLYRLSIDEETGLRAFLPTGDDRFLQPLIESRNQAPQIEAQLEQLITDNPEQQLRNEEVFAARRAWSAWADQAIALSRAGKPTDDLQFQLRGKELMDRYRDARTGFIVREQQLRDERLARSRSMVWYANASILVLCVVVGALLAAFGHRQMMNLSQSFNTALETADASKARVTGIIDCAMDAIITVDQSQRILVFNRAAEQIFRCPQSEALGQPLDKFIPERFRQIHRHHVQDFEKTGVTGRTMYRPGTLWGLRYDGEEFPIEATISQMESHGEKLFTVILRDITERLMSEEALRRADKLATAGELGATIAHEMNNPLAAVTNLAYLIRKNKSLDEKARKQLELLDQEVARMAHMTRRTLGFYRDTASPVTADLGQIMDEVLEIYARKIDSKAIKLQKEYHPHAEATVFPGEMRKVFSNLIANAIDAIRGQGTITVRVRNSHNWNGFPLPGARVTVADSGSGIKPADRRKIFEPFYTTKKETGTGLGLWLSKDIVEKHGGSISVRSKHNGTVFSVFIPAAKSTPVSTQAGGQRQTA
jgi:PAS domain S-box-containing protein